MDFIINDFEGPLDLLLHLIKESKMDIMNIEIEEITKQYMDFLDKQEKMNLEISSEYLVLASELLEIKSRLLLPNNKDESLEEEEDPRDELINRLIEYQAYKNITKLLQDKELLRKELMIPGLSQIIIQKCRILRYQVLPDILWTERYG